MKDRNKSFRMQKVRRSNQNLNPSLNQAKNKTWKESIRTNIDTWFDF